MRSPEHPGRVPSALQLACSRPRGRRHPVDIWRSLPGPDLTVLPRGAAATAWSSWSRGSQQQGRRSPRAAVTQAGTAQRAALRSLLPSVPGETESRREGSGQQQAVRPRAGQDSGPSQGSRQLQERVSCYPISRWKAKATVWLQLRLWDSPPRPGLSPAHWLIYLHPLLLQDCHVAAGR